MSDVIMETNFSDVKLLRRGKWQRKKGIIIADTKMEFGIYQDAGCKMQDASSREGKLILVDEILTPDSSRFWSMKDYAPGKGQDNFDKQIVRDYLLTLDWNQTYPGPELPAEIVEKT
ncbi:phosphoribosylaminoimidazole-succinocarboxamide synthase, partial [Candidatus Hakubella thermalkaliphila]